MSKLILNEKLTLEEKLTLDEKLILDEAVDDLQTSYPEIWDLIEKGDWARAFDNAKKNSTDKQNVIINNKSRLTNEQKNNITKVAESNGFTVDFIDDDKEILLTANDAGTVGLVGELINYLDNKKYLSNNREVNYNDDPGVDIAESVIDEYIERNNVKDKLEDSGVDTLKQIDMVLGLDKYDNPFLDFVDNIDNMTTKLTSEHMTALSTLYNDKTISDEELNGKENSIVENRGLYNNNQDGRDIVELVKTFKEETDENKKLFADDKNIVLNWNTIKQKLYGNRQTKKVDLRDDVWKLNKDFTVDEVKQWYDKLTPVEKLNLRNVVH